MKSKIIVAMVIMTVILTAMTVTGYAEETAAAAESAGLSKLVQSLLGYCIDNPGSIIVTILTGIASGFNLAGGVSNKKTRTEITTDKNGLIKAASEINNNAVKIINDTKSELSVTVQSIAGSVNRAVEKVLDKADEIVDAVNANAAETKRLRRETRATNFIVLELVKESQMTRLRKDQILKVYRDMTEDEEGRNEDLDET